MKKKLKSVGIGCGGLIILLIVISLVIGLFTDTGSEESKPVTTTVLRSTPVPTVVVLPLCTPNLQIPCRTPIPTYPPQPTNTPMPKPLTLLDFRCYHEYGYAHLEGNVRNNTNKRLENVVAVTSWESSGGTFISSHDALIDYNPVMPGQESPFETIGTGNPQMDQCRLSFKEMFGGTIPHDRRK